MGYLLYVVCLSGTLAVFSWELKWLADETIRSKEADGVGASAPISWQAMYDQLATAYPSARILRIAAPRGESWAALGVVSFGARDIRVVTLSPYTGEIAGQQTTFGLVSFLRIFHKQLYLVPGIFGFHGTLVVGALSFLLLVSALTGVLSIKRWWRAFVTLRTGRSRRLLVSDFHRLLGVWPLALTFIFSLTGVWYLAENILIDQKVLSEDVPATRIDGAAFSSRPVSLYPIDLDHAAEIVRAAFPEMSPAHLVLPARHGDPLVFTGQADAFMVRDRANRVEVDPYSGAVIGIRKAGELGLLDRWIETADPVHFGTFGGLATRIVWLIGGIMISGAILFGLYSAWLRLQQTRNAGKGHWLIPYLAIFPTVLVLVLAMVGTALFGGFQVKPGLSGLHAVPLGSHTIGPWKATVELLGALGEPSSRLVVDFGGSHPNISKARAQLITETGESRDIVLGRRFGFLEGYVSLQPDMCAPTCSIVLQLSDYRGGRHQVQFDIPADGSADPVGVPRPDLPAALEIGFIGVSLALIILPLFGWIKLERRMRA